MCDKQEVNFVAKAQNFQQRVEQENHSAKVWLKNWGSLYSNSNLEGEERIAELEEEKQNLCIPKASIAQTSYKPMVAYHEWHDYKRRRK
ncbi:predicted protein [Chaetoceros tenuissimus]|uniref:Uncharacterized protein n=1 Tax=Chaetoceros tenuissimus TaxID=426638 RepID=A0AAD3H311_9STRA|nr:predicted protein [Chaetoceros tenuissimus]